MPRAMPTIAEYETARGIVKPAAELFRLPAVAARPSSVVDDSSQDLVTYISKNLPKWSEVNPTHIFIALGVAFVGISGGVLIYVTLKRQRENRDGQSPTDPRPSENTGLSRTNVMERQSKNEMTYPEIKAELLRRKSIGTGIPTQRPEGVLVLHQCPRGRKTPCIAPYPLKLETFLRTQDIPYEVDFGTAEPRNSDSPWLTLDNEDISDSKNCIRYLCEKYNVNPQSHLSTKDKSLERACHHLLEHHLYWGISLFRWVYDGARSLDKIQYLPQSSHVSIPDVCRTVEQAAWYHGIGKKTPDDVVNEILRDLASLSRILGEKKFFLSNVSPTELDCTAFSMLAQMLWTMDGSPYHAALTDPYKNLSDFCWGMRQSYWPDWDQCLHDGNNSQTLD